MLIILAIRILMILLLIDIQCDNSQLLMYRSIFLILLLVVYFLIQATFAIFTACTSIKHTNPSLRNTRQTECIELPAIKEGRDFLSNETYFRYATCIRFMKIPNGVILAITQISGAIYLLFYEITQRYCIRLSENDGLWLYIVQSSTYYLSLINLTQLLIDEAARKSSNSEPQSSRAEI